VKLTLPDDVSVVVLTEEKFDCPAEFTDAREVPEEGIFKVLKYPLLADILPIDDCVKFNIPLAPSTPKTVVYPFIQFCNIKKLELIVTLDPDIESDPRISVMFTVAIFYFFLF
jgi:hypothetical protein